MLNIAKRYSELNFEDEESMINSADIIRLEYVKKAIKSSILITAILALAISYLFFTYIPNSSNSNFLIVQWHKGQFSLDLTASWALFATSAFLIVYQVRLISHKFTPSLVSYFKQEIGYIGFKFQRKFDSIYLFVIMNIISIAILYYIDITSIPFGLFNPLLRNMILVYLFSSLVVPIIWAFINDRFVIKIKDNVFVLCNLRYRIRRNNKEKEPGVLGILMTSSKLCSKFSKTGLDVHNKISESRWLPRKDNSSPFLYFKEFSIPFNFQKQFLNMVMALNEWETKYDHNMDTMNYYFSREFDYHKYKIKKYPNNDQLIFLKFRTHF